MSRRREVISYKTSSLRSVEERARVISTTAWAIRFYERHGFRQVTPAEKDRMLLTYWSIPERQMEASVVLADQSWFAFPV